MLDVLTIEQALAKIQEHFTLPKKKVTVDLLHAFGQVLAEDIIANENLPGFDRTTMDGFAVIARDTFGASPAQPAYLRVVEDIPMGSAAQQSLSAEEAAKIATGGALPIGSDAVVMLEETEWFDDTTIAILRPVAPGENMIISNEDVKKGQLVLKKDSILRPQDVGVLAGMGITEVIVYQKLRVGIISTGNELVAPDVKALEAGKIRDINTYTLAGLVEEMGAQPNCYGIIPDQLCQLSQSVAKALTETDIVVLSGGSSVGTKDLTIQVLQNLPGFTFLFHGLSVKPGKPTLAATNGSQLIIGLPGHPVSAMVVLQVLMERLLAVSKQKRVVTAILENNIASSAGRVDYVRVKLIEEGETMKAIPVLGKSGLITTMVDSDGYFVIPLDQEGIAAGQAVRVTLYGGGQ